MGPKLKPRGVRTPAWKQAEGRGILEVRDTVFARVVESHGLDDDETRALKRGLHQGALDVPSATVRVVRATEHFCLASRQPLVMFDVPKSSRRGASRSLTIIWFEGNENYRVERRRLYTLLAKCDVDDAKRDEVPLGLPRMMTVYAGSGERWRTLPVHSSGHAGLTDAEIEMVLAALPNAFCKSRDEAMVDEVHDK